MGFYIGNIEINNIYVGTTQISNAYVGSSQIYGGGSVSVDGVMFTAKQSNSTIGLDRLSSNQTLEYSYDGNNWNSMTTGTTITLANSDDSVYIRGILSTDNDMLNYTNFKMSGNIKASGNINYLWNYSNPTAALKQYCGFKLFYFCQALKDVSELELPATTLAVGCYRQMFTFAQFTTAPELPATTLANYCYILMFGYCGNLNYIKCLATDISAGGTDSWVQNVASSGTFVKDANMTNWTTGNDGIPSGWTVTDA